MSFKERVDLFAEHYASDTKISMPISTRCHSCEFYTTDSDEQNGLRSGKKECWQEQLGWSDEDFNEPTVLDVWNFRKKEELIRPILRVPSFSSWKISDRPLPLPLSDRYRHQR